MPYKARVAAAHERTGIKRGLVRMYRIALSSLAKAKDELLTNMR